MIAKRFEEQVKKRHDCTAVKAGELLLSYGELNRYANRVARLILKNREDGETAGQVSLLFDHGSDMIAAIFGALKAGQTYVPLSIDYPDNRLSYMIENSGSSSVLTLSRYVERARRLVGPGVSCLAVDRDRDVPPEADGNPGIDIPGDRLAYIMYTSGSTGRPKGVMQTHENVLYYIENWTRIFSITPLDKMTLLPSFCHDASVLDFYSALLNGATLFPVDVRGREGTVGLSGLLIRERVTVWHSVPSLFAYFANSLDGGEDYKALDRLILGGEAIRAHEIKLAKKFFPRALLASVFGQTESSIDSVWLIRRRDALEHMIIGDPLDRTQILLLDRDYTEVDELEVGEIVIASPHLSPGYWKDDNLSQKTFRNSEELGRLYFTGDLGRLLPGGPAAGGPSKVPAGGPSKATCGGRIEFVGRKDTQVKVRGFRIELGEIESQLLKHPQVAEAVVEVRELDVTGSTGPDEGRPDTYLCAYIVPPFCKKVGPKTFDEEQERRGEPCVPPSTHPMPGSLDSAGLRAFLSQTLPDYMIPTYFTSLDRLPLTQSDKIDRRALPDPETGPAREYTPPRNQVEGKLQDIWHIVLGVEKEQIGIDADFFELGGHSLRGITMLSKAHREFNVQIPVAKIFQISTIRGLAAYIKKAGRSEYRSIQPLEKKDYYPLSYKQERLWFIYQRAPQSPAYNMSQIIELSQEVNRDTLKKTLAELFRRHESLRTAFKMTGDEPVQFVVPRVKELPFREVDISNFEEAEREQEWEQVFKEESCRVFDLTKAPLVRFLLLKKARDNYEFIYMMHHIISDGWSLQILKMEFLHLYECYRAGEPVELAPLKVRYKDFSEWYRRRLANTGTRSLSHRFWREKVEQGIPQLVLPKRIKGDSSDTRGTMYRFLIPSELKENLKKISETHNTTLFMVMFTTFITTLSRYSAQKDIACSIISAGREQESLHPIIGFFVNSLLFKTRLHEEETFSGLLRQVRDESLEYLQHQEYPVERVFEELRKRYPDIPVAFNMFNVQETAAAVVNFGNRENFPAGSNPGAGKIEPFEPYHMPDSRDVKFDLEGYAIEYENGIDTIWVYKQSLFKPETVESFVKDYIRLLEFFSLHPGKSYRDFKVSGDRRKFNRNR